jgi:PEP-CTERM motif
MFPARFGKALGFATAVALIIAGPALSTPAQAYDILYEALGNGGIEAFNLSNPSNPIATLNDPATNIVFGAGNVYFSSGNTVYTTNANLQGFSVFKTFGGIVESLAISPATGVLYVSGSGEIAGIPLSNPSQSIGAIEDPATSMVVGPSSLYFANGNTVYTTSLGLQGLNVFKTFGGTVESLAINPSAGLLYVSGGGEIAGISLSNPSQSIGAIEDPATSMAVGPSSLFFSNGNTVYTTSLGLQGLNVFNTASTSVTGLALSVASVPEPSSLILMLSGMAALGGGWLIRRRGE